MFSRSFLLISAGYYRAQSMAARRVCEVPTKTQALSEFMRRLRDRGLEANTMLMSAKALRDGKMSAKLYTDGWPEFSTAICQIFTPRFSDEADLICYSTSKERLLCLLQEANLITWGKWQLIEGLESSHADYLIDNLVPPEQSKSVLECYREGVNWYLDMTRVPEYALQLSVRCPDGFILGTLHPEHATLVEPYFPYFKDRPKETRVAFYDHVIRHYESSAVFRAEDPIQPIAWIAQYPYGQVLYQYVSPEYRKMSLGCVLIADIARKLMERGDLFETFRLYSGLAKIGAELTQAFGFFVMYERKGLLVKPTVSPQLQANL